MAYENIRVIAYSGYREAETPRVFFINEEKITVAEILDMWIEESISDKTRKRFFTVRGSNKRTYKLHNDAKTLDWFCELERDSVHELNNK